MITYKDIYEIARNERYSENLNKLPDGFIDYTVSYFREKREIFSKNDETFSDVINSTKKQFENAFTLFREIILRRRKKILNLVLIAAETGISKRDFDNMLDFEKDLFNEIMKCVDVSEKKIDSFLNKKKGDKMEKIIFKEDVGEFIDLNGEKIGGFSKEQTATLPKEIARILVEDGKAEVLKE
jgi:DNA replication initiation complex subunit (GINS family)|tara:strand:- start:462 stop:1010 length:549 start_codon:yes stop_codon:yes gene_type:complete